MPCVNHTAFIFDRGATNRIVQLDPITSVRWERVRDDISTARVVLTEPECAPQLALVEAGRHELVLWRGGDRVWEGPVTLVQYEQGRTAIEARDVCHYLDRTALSKEYNNSYPKVDYVINRIKTQLNSELVRMEAQSPPINVLPYVKYYQRSTDARTTRHTFPYQKSVWDEIDDMAQNSGIDYTVLGRALLLFDNDTMIGSTPPLTQADIDGTVTVTQYGLQLATVAAVSGAHGMFGYAGKADPYYGLVEYVVDAWDEQGTSEPTQAELDSQARLHLSGTNPVPTTVRIPDNSTLSPTSAITLSNLVPGVMVPLLADLNGRRFSQNQKLDKVSVTEEPDGEKIQITLLPAPVDGYVWPNP